MKSRLISLKRIVEKEVGHKLHTPNRKRNYTYARAIFCKVAREMRTPKPYSLSEIGEMLNRDHATVLHNINVVFPFAVQESSFRLLYLTLRAIFVTGNGEDEDFDEVHTLGEKIVMLEKENSALKQKLDLLKFGSNSFDRLIEGLSKEEIDEVYEKLDIMVRAIKSRVYI